MLKRGLRKENIFLILSLGYLAIYLILGLFPGYFAANPGSQNSFLNPLVPFSAEEINIDDAFQAPSWQLDDHFLGTDNLGRDVLAGIIHGCQTSLWVSLPAMLLAGFMGLFLGLLAGYFGNDYKRISIIGLILYSVAFLTGIFYGFYLFQFAIREAFEDSFLSGVMQLSLSLLIILLFLLTAYLLTKYVERKKSFGTIALPIDEGVIKLTELFSSVPRLILILALAAFVRPSLGIMVLIIGLTSWTSMTRLIRGEILKVKGLQYVEASKALGLTDSAILLKHILPNAIPPAIVAFTFGLANLLALEATLSFLGIGLPPDFVSWGKIIAGVRYNLSAWWLAVFPGVYLSLTVLALHNCSNYLLNRFDK